MLNTRWTSFFLTTNFDMHLNSSPIKRSKDVVNDSDANKQPGAVRLARAIQPE